MCRSMAAESAATLQEMNPLVAVEAQTAQRLAWVTGTAEPSADEAAWLQGQTLLLLCSADVATQVRFGPQKRLHECRPEPEQA